MLINHLTDVQHWLKRRTKPSGWTRCVDLYADYIDYCNTQTASADVPELQNFGFFLSMANVPKYRNRHGSWRRLTLIQKAEYEFPKKRFARIKLR